MQMVSMETKILLHWSNSTTKTLEQYCVVSLIVDYEKCYLSTPNLLFLNTAPRNLFNIDNNGSQFVIASLPTLKQTACTFIKKETPRKPATLLKR